jgi:adenosylcobinamide kinase/adenosylcobinamide-phosphate guanylyltransferase
MTGLVSPSRTALVLGGARSGKSRFAESLVLGTELPAIYIATAENRDDEMGERIAHHRTRRGALWSTVEAPLQLVEAITDAARSERVVLVDCLTLWLSNLMEAERDPEHESRRLVEAIASTTGPIVFVSNEVGSGIVPMNALARRFADAQGRLNQSIAGAVGSVFLVAAGLPIRLKPNPNPEFTL